MSPHTIEMHYWPQVRSRGDFPQVIGAIRGITVDFKTAGWTDYKVGAPEGTLPWGLDVTTGKILPNSTDMVNHMATMEASMPAMVTDDLQQELMVESNDCPIGYVSPMLNLPSTGGEDTVFYQVPIGEEAWLKLLDTFLAKWSAEYTKAGTTFLSKQSVPGVGEVYFFHVLDVCLMKYPEHVKKHANLLAFFGAYIAVPGIRKFLDTRDKRGNFGMPGSFGRTAGFEPSMEFEKL